MRPCSFALSITVVLASTPSTANAQSGGLGWAARAYPHALPAPQVSLVPGVLELADVNTDGRLDVLASGTLAGLRTALSSPNGGFEPLASLSLLPTPHVLLPADLDRDGNVDLVVRPIAAAPLYVYFGDGDTGFHGGVAYPMWTAGPAGVTSAAVGDLDNDGWPDLVATDGDHRDLVVRLGTGAGLFGTPTSTAFVGYPGQLELADVDGDGNLDALLAGAANTSKLGLMFGDGAGGFSAPIELAMYAMPFATADLDRDGRLDIVVVTHPVGDGSVRVFRGDGLGGFVLSSSQAVAPDLDRVALGDFDGDGWIDAVTASAAGAVYRLRGAAGGGLVAPEKLVAPTAAGPLRAADVDRDGFCDVALQGANSVCVLFGSPFQSLVTARSVALAGTPLALTSGDFDADGEEDVVIARSSGGVRAVEVLHGNGAGDLAPSAAVAIPDVPFDLALGDFDGDQHLDVILSTDSTNRVQVLRGNGSGGLSAPLDLVAGSSYAKIVVGDVDADGFDDACVALEGGNAVALLYGAASLPGPSTVISLPVAVTDLVVRDLDLDGTLDLAIASADHAFVWLRGNGTGFGPPSVLASTRTYTSLDVGDVDFDTWPDVVLGSVEAGVVVRYGSASGPGNDYVLGPTLRVDDVRVLDLDSDLRPDLLFRPEHVGGGMLGVRRGNLAGTGFEDTLLYWTSDQARSSTFVDLDGDGLLEVVVGEPQSPNLRVTQRFKGPRSMSYCTPGTSTAGCMATMSASGVPRVGASSGFTLSANAVEGQRSGLVFFGTTAPVALPWGNGGTSSLCLESPRVRTPLQPSAGTSNQCDGTIAVDWNAVVPPHTVPVGSFVFAQAWYRDPFAVKGSNLSDALAFVVEP